MSKTKHTPGPWHNESHNHGYGPCHVCGPKHVDGGDYAPICIANTEANARLIAAAPELFEAASYAVQFSDADINPTIRKRLQAAINKALDS